MKMFIQQLRTIAASALLLLVFTLGCGGGSNPTPLGTLTSAQFGEYKSALINAIGGNGCACRNYCNYMETPSGYEVGCHDQAPLQIFTLVDPIDNVAKQCHIGCFCECKVPYGGTPTCVLTDELIGWPSPVDPNQTWGPAPA